MNKKTACFILIGIIIGWLTVPLVKADDNGDTRSYIGALRKIIGLMQEVKTLDQQVADNTKAIREKLGAK